MLIFTMSVLITIFVVVITLSTESILQSDDDEDGNISLQESDSQGGWDWLRI